MDTTLLLGYLLAIAAGIWPPGLAAVLVYLDRSPPLGSAYAYLAGAVTTSSIAALVFLGALSTVDLTSRDRRAASAGVTLTLGVLMIGLALVVRSRRPRPPRESVPGNARRGRLGAFVLGLAMWLPSPLYLAALKQISDAGGGAATVALRTTVAMVLLLWIVEVPIVGYRLAPEASGRRLRGVRRWLRQHGRALVAMIAGGLGIVMVLDGLAGLVP